LQLFLPELLFQPTLLSLDGIKLIANPIVGTSLINSKNQKRREIKNNKNKTKPGHHKEIKYQKSKLVLSTAEGLHIKMQNFFLLFVF